MNSQTFGKTIRLPSVKVIAVILISVTLLMLAVAAQIFYTVFARDTVHKGVYVEELNAGNMTASQLKEELKGKYQTPAMSTQLVLKTSYAQKRFTFSDVGFAYDIDGAVNQALEVGRDGNLFSRLGSIAGAAKNNMVIKLGATYDKEKIREIVNSLYDETFIDVKQAELIIDKDKVVLRSGIHGEHIDKDSAVKEIEKALNENRSGEINISLLETPPAAINVDEIYNQICIDARDAAAKVENNEVVVEPYVKGRKINKDELSAIVSQLEKAEGTEKQLPVVYTMPSVLPEDVNSKLFRDTLYTYSTVFYTGNTNDANRGENIRLATSKINGKIIGAGEVFSFNEVVGPRTAEEGYKIAHVYSDGQVVDDVGGGVCQVSTTLYNAALYSDLEIVERTNHMFTVGYVPLGSDAAVAYDYVDFKFANSTGWPIKIEGKVTDDNVLYFTIKGTNEAPEKSIGIYSSVIRTLEPYTVYTNDPNLDEGEEIVTNWGMTGCIVDTYKIIKKDGVVVSEDKIYTSDYQPLNRQVRRGTRKTA